MAKTLVEFENEIIDVMSIFRISKVEKFNVKKEAFDFKIVINQDFDEKFTIRDLQFNFNTEKQRDEALDYLKIKVGELEHINFL